MLILHDIDRKTIHSIVFENELGQMSQKQFELYYSMFNLILYKKQTNKKTNKNKTKQKQTNKKELEMPDTSNIVQKFHCDSYKK